MTPIQFTFAKDLFESVHVHYDKVFEEAWRFQLELAPSSDKKLDPPLKSLINLTLTYTEDAA